MPTSNNPPNWSKDRTPQADNPVFHTFILFGPSSPTLFFLFLSQLHTRILLNLRHLFLISLLTILSVSLYLYSLSYLSVRCACVVIYVACSWYTPPSQKSFSFSFLFFPLLSIQIYCSSPCTDRQYLFFFCLPLLFDHFS